MTGTIIDALETVVAARGSAPFCHVMSGGETATITYDHVWRDSRRVAAALIDGGIQPGEVVVLLASHQPEMYAAFLGAIMAGALPSFMPLVNAKQDAALFWGSHAELFAHLAVRTVVGTAAALTDLRRHLALHDAHLWSVDALVRHGDGRGGADRLAPLAPDATAFLQHSSGTTGLKKGVALSHRLVLEQVRRYGDAIGASAEMRVASWLPLYHDMGLVAAFLLPLLHGASIVSMPQCSRRGRRPQCVRWALQTGQRRPEGAPPGAVRSRSRRACRDGAPPRGRNGRPGRGVLRQRPCTRRHRRGRRSGPPVRIAAP